MSIRKLSRSVMLALVTAAGLVSLSAASALAFLGHPLVSQITQTTEGSPLKAPVSLTFDAAGNLFVVDTGSYTNSGGSAQVDVFNSANAFQGALGAGTLQGYYVRNAAVDHATGDVYVTANEGDRMLVFKPTGTGGYTLLSTWTGANSAQGSFKGWLSVAIDNSTSVSDPHAGDVYVLGEGTIDVFKPKPPGPEEAREGESVGEVTTAGFELPKEGAGVAVDASSGALYVPDSGNQVVDEFNDEGTFVQAFKGSGEPFQPFAVGIDESTHDVYVANRANGLVDEFDNTGKQIGGVAQSLGTLQGLAVNSSGNVYVSISGAVDIFAGTGVLLPDVTTGAAQVEKGGATLEGIVNPDGQEVTNCQFEYGTSESYGQTTACTPAPGSGSSPVTVTAKLTGLEGSTTYHYRLVAGNSNGKHNGFDNTLTTPATVALATEAATEIQATSATLNGVLIPGGLDTHDWFEYGLTSSYGSKTPRVDAGEVAGEELVFVKAPVTGLEPNTTYHFRLAAENTFGVAHGADETLTTKASPPGVGQGLSVSAITRTTASVSPGINPEKSPTTYRIVYGESSSYGEHSADFEAGAGLGEATFHVGLIGLVPGMTFHYTVMASNQGGTTTGPDETFTTAAPTPPSVSTGGASNVTLTTATVSGTIDPAGLETSYELDLGTDTTYGTSIYGEAGSSTEEVNIAVALQNLAPGATYHYRIVAINSDGKVYGADQTFTTPAYSAPIVQPFTLPLLQALPIAFPKETGGTINTKTLTRAQKLANALKACKKKAKKKRASCEKQARKRYHAVKKNKKA